MSQVGLAEGDRATTRCVGLAKPKSNLPEVCHRGRKRAILWSESAEWAGGKIDEALAGRCLSAGSPPTARRRRP